MEQGDQLTAPLEDTVAMDSPTIQENQLWTLDMSTEEVLDSQYYVEKLREQTVDDGVEDSVKDIVLDSDEEGNEVLSMTSGGLSLMETNGEHTSKIDGGKHAALGNQWCLLLKGIDLEQPIVKLILIHGRFFFFLDFHFFCNFKVFNFELSLF